MNLTWLTELGANLKIIIILKHYIHVCTHWNMEMEWLTALYAVGENK